MRNRVNDKFKGFSYNKVYVDSEKTFHSKGVPVKIIAWEVKYNNSFIMTCPSLKEAILLIKTKSDN